MRYTYFASVAKKEGYEQIAAIFTETADQEKEHAKRMFKWLEGGMVEITASYPAGVIGTTLENLQEAAAGEHEEWSLDYPKFADIADEEGFPEIALMYRNIAIAEKGHEERYRAFIQNIETASVFAKEGEVVCSAATVVSSTPVRKLLRYVRLACIRRLLRSKEVKLLIMSPACAGMDNGKRRML